MYPTSRTSWTAHAMSFALLLGAGAWLGCSSDMPDGPDADRYGLTQGPLQAWCTANVKGKGNKQVEGDYLAHVVRCENGSAPLEALKAQAVAARSYLYYKLNTSGSIADGTSDQVYSCGAEPSAKHYQAVEETAGQVLRYNNTQVAAFYVAGAVPSTANCVAKSNDYDYSNTEKWVTYNQGKSGNGITQTPLGWVNAGNYANRDCKSQNGAACLANKGWGYQNILKFYYGADIQMVTAQGSCVNPTPTCDCDPGETQSKACGSKCGTQKRTCNASCTWGAWGDCSGQGACSPGAVDSKACGDCGSQKRTCSNQCGWGGWSGCTGEGPCAPGASQVQACGMCGEQSRTCSGQCKWAGWGACAGEGACAPGAVSSEACGECGLRESTCDDYCQWGAAGSCEWVDPDAGASCQTLDAGACANGVLKCLSGMITCVATALPTDEVCDGVDNDCDGDTDNVPLGGALGDLPPPLAATLLVHEAPTELVADRIAEVTVSFRNVGSEMWAPGTIQLVASGPAHGATSHLWDSSWLDADTAAVIVESVGPGSVTELKFVIRAPSDPHAAVDEHCPECVPDDPLAPVVVHETFALVHQQSGALRCPEPSLRLAVTLYGPDVDTTGGEQGPGGYTGSNDPSYVPVSGIAPSSGGGCTATGAAGAPWLGWVLLALLALLPRARRGAALLLLLASLAACATGSDAPAGAGDAPSPADAAEVSQAPDAPSPAADTPSPPDGQPAPDGGCAPCETGADCAAGTCEAFESAAGAVQLCVPAVGTCLCPAEAIAAGAWTACASGACTGLRTCLPEGLGVCTAPTPATEVCDGVDNDCDGAIDEDFAELGEPCTRGSGDCAGSGDWVCLAGGQGVTCSADPAPDGAPCGPAATACQTAGHCVSGACDVGSPLDCDDELVCTIDGCEPDGDIGCTHSLVPGACLIGGGCVVQGTVDPENPCQRCTPSASTVSWTITPIPNAVDLCGDGIDNDCSGDADTLGDGCVEVPVSSGGATAHFTSTAGHAAWPVVDLGDDDYRALVAGLVNPNASVEISTHAHGLESEPWAFTVAAMAPASLDIVLLRAALYVGSATTSLVAQVSDAEGRPVGVGTVVHVQFGALGSESCATDAQGRCSVIWTAPASAFDVPEGPAILPVSATVGGLPAAEAALELHPAPPPLSLSEAGGGSPLPAAPLFPGDSFDVPIFLYAGGPQAIGSYDIHVAFDAEIVKPTSFVEGSCSAFGLPISNIGVNAAQTGVLKMNAINFNPGHDCAAGASVHVVTIRFKVLESFDPGADLVDVMLDPLLVDLFSVDLLTLAQSQPFELAGHVQVWGPIVRGILARPPGAALRDTSAITGAAESATLTVDAFRRDFTTADVTDHALTAYTSDDPTAVTVTDDGVVTAAGQGAAATITVTHGATAEAAESCSTRVAALALGELMVVADDPTLETIAGAGGAVQRTRVHALAEWHDVSGLAWTEEVTSAVDLEAGVGLTWSPGPQSLAGEQAGVFEVSIAGPGAAVSAPAQITVAPTSSVEVTGLTVVAPCAVHVIGVDQTPGTVEPGQAGARARVAPSLAMPGQTCQVRVVATLSDGSRMDVTGQPGVTVLSQHPMVCTATDGGLLTAVSDGQAAIVATWFGPTDLLGVGQVLVDVGEPAPVSLHVGPAELVLARSATDPAATLLDMPNSAALSVVMIYADGSSTPLTGDPGVAYAPGPDGLLEVSDAGVVTATGEATGAGEILVSVPQLPEVPAAVVGVEVVGAASLVAEIYEPYTPSPPRVVDHSLSPIEGTGAWQRATYEVLLTFDDGTVLDVTAAPATSATVLAPGTEQELLGALSFDAGTVHAEAGGVFDLRFEHAGLSNTIAGFSVGGDALDVTELWLESPSGATLFGVAGDAVGSLETSGVLSDGTRHWLSGAETVPGLLAYAIQDPLAAAIDPHGAVTILGNSATSVTVSVAANKDVGSTFEPPAKLAMATNLDPGCGDVDHGEQTGAAFPDRVVGEQFVLEGRINTCGVALGTIEVTVTYDPSQLAVVGVSPGTATVGAAMESDTTVSGNATVKATLDPGGARAQAPDLHVYSVAFEAIAPGAGAVSGVVTKAVALTDQAPLGAPTPRALVAGAGVLRVIAP